MKKVKGNSENNIAYSEIIIANSEKKLQEIRK